MISTEQRQQLAYCGAPGHSTAILECPACMERLSLVVKVASIVRADTLNEAMAARVESAKCAARRIVIDMER